MMPAKKKTEELVPHSKEISLRVTEALPKDVGRGIARVDPAEMDRLGIGVGGFIRIEGKKTTAAKVMPTFADLRGKGLIQIDGVSRENAKVGIDEKVKVSATEVALAKSITLKALSPLGVVERSGETRYLGKLVEGLAVTRGDKVRVTLFGTRTRDFVAVQTVPDGVIMVTAHTTIRVEEGKEAKEKGEAKRPSFVAYEDVGGLDREIQRVREMIELPLKNPQVFERLGIEPPKGVLLYGPPGTGKTLIARAVAHEADANFYTVNGPEIVHKFYGESLPGNELILTLKNGSFERKPIAQVVKEKDNSLQVPCFDNDGKLCFGKVTGFFQHSFKGKIKQVRTRSGRSIRVTDDHSLFEFTKEGIQSTPTSFLKIGSSFIAVPKRLPFNPKPLVEINLLPLLKDDPEVVLRGTHVEQIVSQAITALGTGRCSEILRFRERYVGELVSKHVGLRAPLFLNLAKEAALEVVPEKVVLSTIKRTKGIPAILKISEDLCSFFGWWLAEGSFIRDHCIRISVNLSEADYVGSLCRGLFGKLTVYEPKDKNSADIIVSSTTFVKTMRAMGFNSGAREKVLPDFIYNLSRGNMAALLRGYYSGDGSVNRTTPAPQVEVSTASHSLADGICHLLLYFGIVAKIYDKPLEGAKRVCFADSENLKRFLEIGFADPNRNEVIRCYLATSPASRRDKIPFEVAKEYLGWRGDAWEGQSGIGVEAFKKNTKFLPTHFKPALEEDLFWDKVVAIEEMSNQPEFVYDIAVAPGENFIAGFGGIFAHNSEAHLRSLFEEATRDAPSILFIDEIDAIAPKRAEIHGEVEKRIVATLLSMMDGLKGRGNLIVIGATNIPDVIDPALRRPGRFDREIQIGIPDRNGRLKILEIHTRGMPLSADVSLEKLADISHGYVGADLEALAREAAMTCLRESMEAGDITLEEIPYEVIAGLEVTQAHFIKALNEVEPSAIREVSMETPNVHWSDIGGLEDVKKVLRETVEWPLRYGKLFQKANLKPTKGILLAGPPGTGKTLLAKALAAESEVNFISIKGPELISKWVGESEKGIREIFKKAKSAAPCILFFDEIDSIVPKRGAEGDSGVMSRTISQFLTELDGLEELRGVVILGATNRLDLLDPALVRPGRFDHIIGLGMPDPKARETIFKIHTKGCPMEKGVDFTEMARETEGRSGAEIESICRQAITLAIREFIETNKEKANEKAEKLVVRKEHFEAVVKKMLHPPPSPRGRGLGGGGGAQ